MREGRLRQARRMWPLFALVVGGASLAAAVGAARTAPLASPRFVISVRGTQTTTWSVPSATAAVIDPKWNGDSCIHWISSGQGRHVTSFAAGPAKARVVQGSLGRRLGFPLHGRRSGSVSLTPEYLRPDCMPGNLSTIAIGPGGCGARTVPGFVDVAWSRGHLVVQGGPSGFKNFEGEFPNCPMAPGLPNGHGWFAQRDPKGGDTPFYDLNYDQGTFKRASARISSRSLRDCRKRILRATYKHVDHRTGWIYWNGDLRPPDFWIYPPEGPAHWSSTTTTKWQVTFRRVGC